MFHSFFLSISEAPTKIVVQRVGDKVPEADSGEVVAAAGEDLELECISTGANPAPVLKWYMISRAGQMEEVAGAKHSQVKIEIFAFGNLFTVVFDMKLCEYFRIFRFWIIGLRDARSGN